MFCQSQIIINTGRNTRPVLRPWWEIIRKGRINAATRPVLRPWWEIIRKGHKGAATRPVLRPVNNTPPAPVFAGYIGVYIRYRPPQKSPVYSCE
jgi:hypothetical protein